MELKINTTDKIQIVTIEGDIDSSVASVVTDKIVPLATAKAKIIIDMTEVAYMSSAGLRTLLSIHRQATNNEAQLILVGISEDIKDTMSVTGFLNFFTISESLESAKGII
ncbi:anti-sigma factor antagonist [Geminocystis sp. GBBB08]|uniref:anti-sigma factor antagonist n=1 Tax=Geminocystis sp. GBBB08 TaxID=2604140 RepID=UPI0027E3B17B|nr:anti-sigma factor antagonist [Geminocystis sp. GBBB08]MBL1211565.1 anti-sigma factor antagonist [Geminocystis sp. GBBB08]